MSHAETETEKIKRRAKLWPALRARPRLLASLLFGFGALYVATRITDLSHAADTLIAWNAGALMNLALTWHMVWRTDVEAIKRRAVAQDQGRITILTVVVLTAAAVLLAVGTQLSQVKDLSGTQRVAHLLLAILTVVTSWLFTQCVFAVHYAHDFYTARLRKAPDPLDFPGTPDPLYS